MIEYGRRELVNSTRAARRNTIQIAEDVPEASYDFRATPDTRSIRELLVHIAWLTNPMLLFHEAERYTSATEFDVFAAIADSKAMEGEPHTKAEIVALLRREGERWADWLEHLAEERLVERVAMPDGSTQTRFEMLVGMKEHELHHQSQLTVLQRLVGVVPHFTRALDAMRPVGAPLG